MKSIVRSAIFSTIVLLIISCSKSSTTPPSAAETNATLLAGAKGSSKTWTITKINQTKNGADNGSLVPGDGSLPTCESDNVFQFTSNTTQDYIVTEGTVNCNPGTDPTTIEKGTWALTSDGKSLVVDGSVYPTSTQFQDSNEPFLGFMILNQGEALTIVQLTATVLVVSYSYTYNSANYVITLSFAKV